LPTFAKLAAVYAMLGKILTVEEYQAIVVEEIKPFEGDLDRYLNFNEIKGFEDKGRVISKEPEALLV
jgi:aconitate hydratase 2 / 2-methylisocitrate dehydratase